MESTINHNQIRTAIVEALGNPDVMNHNVIAVDTTDGSVECLASMTLSDISFRGREDYVIIYSFEGIDHDGTSYIYPDGSTVETTDEEYIAGIVESCIEAINEIEAE